jgi:hypothetical protein
MSMASSKNTDVRSFQRERSDTAGADVRVQSRERSFASGADVRTRTAGTFASKIAGVPAESRETVWRFYPVRVFRTYSSFLKK